MRKQLSLFLAVIFIAVQMGSFAHMAKFGFEHEHSGHPCQIEAYFKTSQNFDSASAEIAVTHENSSVVITYSFVDDFQNGFKALSDNPARAPPFIS